MQKVGTNIVLLLLLGAMIMGTACTNNSSYKTSIADAMSEAKCNATTATAESTTTVINKKEDVIGINNATTAPNNSNEIAIATEKATVEAPSPFEVFANEVATSISKRQTSFFNKHFYLSPILKQITSSVKAPEAYETAFKAGVKDAINAGEEIVNSLKKEGTYTLLHLTESADEKAAIALFRLLAEDGINYHELQLAYNKKGDVYIQDFLIFQGGLAFSETLKKLYISSLQGEEVSFTDANGIDALLLKNMKVINEINELASMGGFKDAWDLVNNLPAGLRADKMVQIMKLDIGFQLGTATYNEAIADFKAYFPNDPIIDFMQFDYAFANKDKEGILSKVDQLDASIGGDVYLKVIKAKIYITFNKLYAAEMLLETAHKSEPNNEQILRDYTDFMIEQARYEEAVDLLVKLGDAPLKWYAKGRKYRNFKASTAYEKWQEKATTPTPVPTEEQIVKRQPAPFKSVHP